MNEIIFEVEEANEGGYTARALGEPIFTEGDDLDDLRANIRDAINCHFEPGNRPEFLQLQIRNSSLSDEQMAELESRLEDYRLHPESGIPWEEVRDGLRQRTVANGDKH